METLPQDTSSGASKYEEAMSAFGWARAEVAKAVEEALNPKTIMTRALLTCVPALIMILFRVICVFFEQGCEHVRLVPRTFDGLLLGVPLCPFTHLTNAQLWVDLGGWFALAFSMTSYGTRFFVTAISFLALFSGLLTWLVASNECAGLGTNGVLFGIFGFHLSILPFRRPVLGIDVASFVIFDLGFGGIWWFTSYQSNGASPCLSCAGFLGGVVFAWIFFREFQEDLENPEHAPLLGKSLSCAEKAVDNVADKGLQGLGEASDAAKAYIDEATSKSSFGTPRS